MPYGQTRIDEVEAAVIALLKAQLAGAGVTDIAALTRQDMDEDDNILIQPPAVRVVFVKEDLAPLEDQDFQDYRSDQMHVALAGAERPTTVDIERGVAQNIAELVKKALAGARIALTSNPDGAVIGLVGVELFQMVAEGTWYAVKFCVRSYSEFSGNIAQLR